MTHAIVGVMTPGSKNEDQHYGTACADNADRVGDSDVWVCRICDSKVAR